MPLKINNLSPLFIICLSTATSGYSVPQSPLRVPAILGNSYGQLVRLNKDGTWRTMEYESKLRIIDNYLTESNQPYFLRYFDRWFLIPKTIVTRSEKDGKIVSLLELSDLPIIGPLIRAARNSKRYTFSFDATVQPRRHIIHMVVFQLSLPKQQAFYEIDVKKRTVKVLLSGSAFQQIIEKPKVALTAAISSPSFLNESTGLLALVNVSNRVLLYTDERFYQPNTSIINLKSQKRIATVRGRILGWIGNERFLVREVSRVTGSTQMYAKAIRLHDLSGAIVRTLYDVEQCVVGKTSIVIIRTGKDGKAQLERWSHDLTKMLESKTIRDDLPAHDFLAHERLFVRFDSF
jgi:hypothetical protein